MIKKSLLVYTVISILITSICCTKKQKNETEITFVDGVEIISNPTDPRKELTEYVLKDDLSIGLTDGDDNYLLNNVSDIDVDNNGNIYVVDSGNTRIQVYDSRGKYIRTIGNKGQGPGEFSFLEQIDIGLNGKIATFDITSRRISIFSTNGSLIKDFLVKENRVMPVSVYWSSPKKIITMFPILTEGQKQNLKLVQYDSESNKISELAEFVDVPDGRDREGTKLTLWTNCPRKIWVVNRSGDIFAGLNDKYEINVYSSDGILKRIIKRKYLPVKVPEKTKKNISETFEKNKNKIPTMLQMEMKSYDYYPAFHNFLIDDQNNLWVEVRLYSQEKNMGHIYDIFDPDGIYINRVKLDCLPQVIKGKYIYSTQRSRDGVNFVKRFRYEKK